jgi:hypothetical protein
LKPENSRPLANPPAPEKSSKEFTIVPNTFKMSF